MPIFTKREEDFVLGQDILPGPFNSLFDGIYTDLNLLAVDFYGSSEPTSTAYGMKWHDTGETPNVIRVYTSGDTDRWLWMGIWIGAEVNRPSYPATGAIWIDSENNNNLYLYSGTEWIAAGISTTSVVSYDNTDSGLTATDVKAAIDEIVTSINTKVNTSDYEDLDVLNKVKAVDGSGSGLDADLLDGQHVSDIVNSPALTGTPTAPTAPVGTNTTQIATTEFVNVVLDTNIYARNSLPSIKGTSVAADRYTWQSPAGGLVVGINGTVYALTTQTEIDLSNAANWDTATPDYTVASARAGKDFYVYACEPASGNTPDIVLSASSTYPSGYTADNSRKISGFHCVCANIGTITGHPLSGFVAGDILPLSVWDLRHRPKTASPEGMVWSEAANIWVDIYLQSGTGATTASAYGATITDTRTWMDHVDDLSDVNKRLLDDGEFQKIAAGGNEETNIAGSADPGTTGGHNDTSGRRMVSSIGCEDCAGVMHQWLSDQSYRYSGTTSFAWVDLPGGKGDIYIQGSTADVKLQAGGDWGVGAGCGSRCRVADGSRWNAYSGAGARGAAEPA